MPGTFEGDFSPVSIRSRTHTYNKHTATPAHFKSELRNIYFCFSLGCTRDVPLVPYANYSIDGFTCAYRSCHYSVEPYSKIIFMASFGRGLIYILGRPNNPTDCRRNILLRTGLHSDTISLFPILYPCLIVSQTVSLCLRKSATSDGCRLRSMLCVCIRPELMPLSSFSCSLRYGSLLHRRDESQSLPPLPVSLSRSLPERIDRLGDASVLRTYPLCGTMNKVCGLGNKEWICVIPEK